jgi:DNA invertase Pin-like site-specific DNA recombinase
MLAAARARGRKGGRFTIMTKEKVKIARQMYDARELTVDEIAQTLRVSRASIYRHLDERSVIHDH